MSSVIFESLSNPEFPTDIVAENLLRLLNYEPESGISELVRLLVDAAGCDTTETTTTSFLKANAAEIESACLLGAHPSVYPALRNASFAKRLTDVLRDVSDALHDVGEPAVLDPFLGVLEGLMRARLQSLRYAATLMAAALLPRFPQLAGGLRGRCVDAAPSIRKMALAASGGPEETLRALQDKVPEVRLAALRRAQDFAADPPIADRVFEMGLRDVNLAVRRASLRMLARKGIVNGEDGDDPMLRMLADADPQSRALAADLVVMKAVSEANGNDDSASEEDEDEDKTGDTQCSALVQLAATVSATLRLPEQLDEDALETTGGLARALRRQTTGSGSGPGSVWETACVRALAAPSQFPALRGSAHAVLLGILKGFVQQNPVDFDFMGQWPRVLNAAGHNDALLAGALRALADLDLPQRAARSSDSEAEVRQMCDAVADTFASREDPGVLHAAALVLAKLPLSLRSRLRALYSDVRLELAGALGPQGRVSGPKRKAALELAANRVVQLAAAVDVSDTLKLPVLVPIRESPRSPCMLALVRTIGMTSTDVDVIKQVVALLASLDAPKPVDDILRVCVAAKMRGIDDVKFPLDVNVHTVHSESVWRAAVAAEVV